MENVSMIAIVVAGVVCGIVALGLYSVYGGVRADLCSAKVGQVFNFEYLQPLNGEPERYKAKVIEPVARLEDSWISVMNKRSRYRRNDPDFKRTNHLVTCKTSDGNVRQFYCERAVNCRRSLLAGWLV